MKELQELIKTLETMKEKYKTASEIKAKLHGEIFELEERICNFMAENGIKQIDLDDKTIKAEFSQKLNILGGNDKNPENKTAIVHDLIELGYLDDEKVRFYEGAAVHAATLSAALKKLDLNQIAQYEQSKKIGVSFMPKVTVK